MKNSFKLSLLAVAIATCSTAVFFTACKKESNNLSTNTEKSTSKQSEQDKQTELKIRAFRSQVQSNARIAENMTTEEALWYIEAALNYTFCRGSQGILMPEVDTTYITLTETSTGVVAFAEVAKKYTTLAALMETNAATLAQNNRQYMLVDVVDLGSNNGTINMQVTMSHGEIAPTSGNARVTEWTGFNRDDNWYYGEKLGRIKADGQRQYVGQYDATTVLTNAVNTGQGVVTPTVPYDPNNPYYFTNCTTIYINIMNIQSNYPAPGQPNNNILDYYAYYKSRANNNNQPLEDSMVLKYTPFNEMNFYLSGLYIIKGGVDAILPENMSLKSCKFIYKFELVNYPYPQRNKIYHEIQFEYGIRHNGVIPD